MIEVMTKPKEKIAIYARVSTESVEQDSSFQSQIKYFTDKFSDTYDIVKVYSDKGSGLSLKNRPQFQQMIKDAGLDIEERKGKVNTYVSNRQPQFKYILTKSVSRFSRNSETVTIIRDLKQKGVFVIFDDINKSTEDDESEMLLGFLQSISQEESRNKSQIVKWGKQRSAEANHVSLQADVYGYKANYEENTLRLVENEADIIRKIFNLAEEGSGARKIKRLLTEQGIFNRESKPFTEHHLLYMLQNPRYTGLNVRGRFEKVDLFSPHKQKEKAQSEWIVQETDKIDKIIEKEQFDNIQKLIGKRSSAKKGVHLAQGELAQKIKCGKCGAFYTRNREVYKTGNVRVFYICGTKKRKGVKVCNGRNVGQDEIDKTIDLYVNTDFYKKFYKHATNTYIQELETRKKDVMKQKNNDNLEEINEIKDKIKLREGKLNILLENILENPSETLKNVYNKKIEEIEKEVVSFEKRLKELETSEDLKTILIGNIELFISKISNYELKEFKNREEFLEDLMYFRVYDEKEGLFANTRLNLYLAFVKSIIDGDLTSIKEDQKKYIEDLSYGIRLS